MTSTGRSTIIIRHRDQSCVHALKATLVTGDISAPGTGVPPRQVNVEVEAPPSGCDMYHETLLTANAVIFLAELVREFDSQVDKILREREAKKIRFKESQSLPDFLPETKHIRDADWMVDPLPRRLECRHVDLGDVSPSNTKHFEAALQSSAQGIQTDFDDGHCPSWRNELLGHYNVYRAVRNTIPGVPRISRSPVLMLRPRAWNMTEHNMLVDGREVPGPLFDFGLLMFHNARRLLDAQSGPYFYLSKLESHQEARLWNDIFVWTQKKLGLPHGSIKACVLIENVLASFEMDEILHELKHHSLGLNCGIWDYSASFINKFGDRGDFVLPDRNKYVSMERHFLSSYMDLVVQTCHQRGAHATGGMAATLLPADSKSTQFTRDINAACRAKLGEIKAGVDGFMVYDARLLAPMQQMWNNYTRKPNQLEAKRSDVKVTASDLLVMPSGGVTAGGLKHNISVGILFIYNWLRGQGHFFFKGSVEDSATAEISRSQVWQWIHHGCRVEQSHQLITRTLIKKVIQEVIQENLVSPDSTACTSQERHTLVTAARMFEQIVTKREFPEFITTYLSLEHTFNHAQSML